MPNTRDMPDATLPAGVGRPDLSTFARLDGLGLIVVAKVQLAIHGHRGFKGGPLYTRRRTLHTGAGLLTNKQTDALQTLFADISRVEATWVSASSVIAGTA